MSMESKVGNDEREIYSIQGQQTIHVHQERFECRKFRCGKKLQPFSEKQLRSQL